MIGIDIIDIVPVFRNVSSSIPALCLPEIISFGIGSIFLRPPINVLVLDNGG